MLEHTLKDHLLNMLEHIFHDTHYALVVVVEVFVTFYSNFFFKSADLGYFPKFAIFPSNSLKVRLGKGNFN